MQVVKLPLLRFTKNIVFSNSLTYIIMKWPKLCTSFLNKPFLHILIAYLTRSLPYMNAALDLKVSKIFIFLNSQPPGVKILFKYQGSKIWNSVTTDFKPQTFRKFKINYKNLRYCSKVTIKLRLILVFISIFVLSIINFYSL